MEQKIKLSCLDLSKTLFCGQCFRFEKIKEGVYRGFAGSKPVTLRQEPDGVTIENCGEVDLPFWKNYFAADEDYDEILKGFSADPVLLAACENPGIRVLRQDPFETLISFIISQNNNIKRISGIISRLCENFGEPVGDGYAFPTAERLAALSPEDLAPLRAGFRDRYIIDGAQKVYSGKINLEDLKSMPADEGRKKLMEITGVGQKVADCVLLFGLGKLEIIPKDVWMKRVAAVYYPDGFPDCMGKYGGIAQQYLFDYARKNHIHIG